MEEIFGLLMKYCEAYGYPVLFGGVLLENAGIPVPGETAVLVAAILASKAGGHRFKLWVVILVTVLAAIVGDNLGFWLGRLWARPRLQKGQRFLFLTPTNFRKAESYFNRFGVWTILFGRFVTGLRVVGAIAAGTAGMSWLPFLAANTLGAIAWAVTVAMLGYWFGQNWRFLEKWLRRGGWIALAIFLVLFTGFLGWRWWRKRPVRFQEREVKSKPTSSS